MANETKLKIEADVAGFVAAKETVKKGLDEIDGKAQAVGASASRALDRVAASAGKAGKAGSGVGASVGSGAGAAVGGAATGRAAGGLLGALGGGIGVAVGSAIGSVLGNLIGGDGRPSREEERQDRIGQMIARGFNTEQAKAFTQLANDVSAKFKVDQDRVIAAIVEAKAGDEKSLGQLLESLGMKIENMTAQQGLDQLAASSAGAEMSQRGAVEKALDRAKTTERGGFLADFFSGVARAPKDFWQNVKGGFANDVNRFTDWFGGDVTRPMDAPATTAPALPNGDAVLQKPPRTGRVQETKVLISSPKAVPTTVRNMAGR